VSTIRPYKATEMAAAKPVTWRLAPGYLAAGKVGLLVGDEGIGKSLWTIRAIEAVTTGEPWGPFTIASDPANVTLIATEDGWEDTIRPRLEVTDADLSRLVVLCENPDGTGHPTFPTDISVLRQLNSPGLVVVDAWIDTVDGGVDVKYPQKARAAIAPWKAYAAESDASVLLTMHTNRNDRQNLRNTYGLSAALRQVARSTLYAAEDPDTSALLVGPDKSNLGKPGVAERFERTSVELWTPTPHNDGTVGRLDYIGSDSRTIAEALSEQREFSKPQRSTDAIDAWLREVLADGPMKSTDLIALADEEGYSTSQLHQSRSRLGVQKRKESDGWVVWL
jgi:AAA domain-containing protein